jgi:type IV secretory pathway protease TraF
MITNSKLVFVLAIAALAIGSPAFAQSPRATFNSARSQPIGRNSVDNPALTGGGSAGYNQDLRRDY